MARDEAIAEIRTVEFEERAAWVRASPRATDVREGRVLYDTQ
jgi:hypothetical protein